MNFCKNQGVRTFYDIDLLLISVIFRNPIQFSTPVFLEDIYSEFG